MATLAGVNTDMLAQAIADRRAPAPAASHAVQPVTQGQTVVAPNPLAAVGRDIAAAGRLVGRDIGATLNVASNLASPFAAPAAAGVAGSAQRAFGPVTTVGTDLTRAVSGRFAPGPRIPEGADPNAPEFNPFAAGASALPVTQNLGAVDLGPLNQPAPLQPQVSPITPVTPLDAAIGPPEPTAPVPEVIPPQAAPIATAVPSSPTFSRNLEVPQAEQGFTLDQLLQATGPAQTGLGAIGLLNLGSRLVAQEQGRIGTEFNRERATLQDTLGLEVAAGQQDLRAAQAEQARAQAGRTSLETAISEAQLRAGQVPGGSGNRKAGVTVVAADPVAGTAGGVIITRPDGTEEFLNMEQFNQLTAANPRFAAEVQGAQ